MDLSRFIIQPEQLWERASPIDLPLAIIDLSSDRRWPDFTQFPPCPLIGLGSRTDPHAADMDVIVEPPVTVETLATAILAQPVAAELFTALMRMHRGPDLSRRAMLDAESFAYGALQASDQHRQWIESRKGMAAMPAGAVLVERDDAILRVTLNRPAADNAIDCSLRDGLHDAFTFAASDPEIARIEIRSTGRSFSLGADLAEFGTTLDPAVAHGIRARTLPARALARFRGLVDVHVQGACVGSGLEIAAFGTWVTASQKAWFQLPELAMGIIPGAGGCYSLPRRIGAQRTALMVLSGRRIPARIALDWGLIDQIVDDPA